MPLPPKCTHCQTEAVFTDGKAIYPNLPHLHTKKFWKCPACEDSYVGCHSPGAKTDKGISDGSFPFGTPANASLRQWRMKAHEVFDPVWKHRHCQRAGAYAHMAKKMGIAKKKCHISLFDEAQCREFIRIARETWPQVCGENLSALI